MIRILLTAATQLEVFTILRRWKTLRSKTKSGITLYKAEISGTDVDLLLTRVGLTASGRIFRQCLVNETFDLIVNAGAAGSLSPDLLPGMIMLPDSFISENTAVISAPEDYREKLTKACRNCGIEPRAGRLYSSQMAISNTKVRLKVAEKYQAQAVDMEAAAQADAAQTKGIPFVCLKVITDLAQFPVLPRYFANLPTVNRKLREVLENYIDNLCY